MAARSSAHAAYTAAAAALLCCTFALLSSFAQADCGGFAVSCSGIDVDARSGFLRCVCGDGQGGQRRAGIDLNAFISNDNGNLVDGGGFAASCNNIRWYQLGTDNQGVAAECRRVDGSLGSTTLYNVERRVSNNRGNLVFNVCASHTSLQEAVDAGRKMLKM